MNQEKYDKLIAIASSMVLALRGTGVESLEVETCHGVNEGNIEFMKIKDIDAFLDNVFEYEV